MLVLTNKEKIMIKLKDTRIIMERAERFANNGLRVCCTLLVGTERWQISRFF